MPGESRGTISGGNQDFFWSTSDEPHASRRKAILEKHPEIAELAGGRACFEVDRRVLFCSHVGVCRRRSSLVVRRRRGTTGYDWRSKYVVLLLVGVQIYVATRVQYWSWPAILVAAYVVGGTITQSLTLAIHEISHNLMFESVAANRWFGIFANLPLVVAYSMCGCFVVLILFFSSFSSASNDALTNTRAHVGARRATQFVQKVPHGTSSIPRRRRRCKPSDFVFVHKVVVR